MNEKYWLCLGRKITLTLNATELSISKRSAVLFRVTTNRPFLLGGPLLAKWNEPGGGSWAEHYYPMPGTARRTGKLRERSTHWPDTVDVRFVCFKGLHALAGAHVPHHGFLVTSLQMQSYPELWSLQGLSAVGHELALRNRALYLPWVNGS